MENNKEIEEREFKSFFKDLSDGNEARRCNYTTRLDTYGTGCAHDCRYCYAKSLPSFRGLWKPKNPAVSDIDEIRKVMENLPRDLCCGPHQFDFFIRLDNDHVYSPSALTI